MNIIVPIKQVPETSNVKMDPETGTMVREGVESIINPLDLYAIEVAIQLKERDGGRVTVLSMGPPSAEHAIREAVAMGCDDGVLLSNRRFAGADTGSTSYVLATAIRKLTGFDLVLCGERATDGDTGQVGPAISAWLDIPVSTYISKIADVRDRTLIMERLVEDGYETLQIERPCLLTVIKEIAYPRLPTLRGKQRARKIDVPVWGPDEIGADAEALGLKGSLTRVIKIERPVIARGGDIRVPKSPVDLQDAIEDLVSYLEDIDIL